MSSEVATLTQAGTQPCSAEKYLNRTLARHLAMFLRKCLRGLYHVNLRAELMTHSPGSVCSTYNELRQKVRSWTQSMTLDDLVYGNASYEDPRTEKRLFVLLDDRIVWSVVREPRSRLVGKLEEVVRSCVPPGGLAVEFGSGDGRNLLHLKRVFPDRSFIGLEISPDSVGLAQELSNFFGLPLAFHECDVSSDIPPDLQTRKADMVFSVHTLQDMPRIFYQALMNMINISQKHVILFEPVWELWPWNRRGLASRLWCLNNDYAHGLMSAISKLTDSTAWRLTHAERLHFASVPFSETCELRLERREGV